MKNIEIVARGVLVKGGRILLCRNRRHGNVYLPGGHVDWGEDSKRALEREWLEELGVKGKAGRFLGVMEQRYVAREGDTCEIALHFQMSCAVLSPTRPAPSAEAHIAFDWVPMDRLGASGLLPALLRRRIPCWLETDHSAAPGWTGYPR